MQRQTRNYVIAILSVDIENSRRYQRKQNDFLCPKKTFYFRQEKQQKTH